ncbi:hypothetical protein BIW11_05697 [Tropilaelaps mercedesae]|uniref:Uncharacterized protein n=1 Tax=Tropilaelaps mercedesae TaxID=418985 RepID=A0A1V9Y1C6_9ACAR|nr:hypothetical protein BIW11_05697 [Tropilaelaps mercedesae]
MVTFCLERCGDVDVNQRGRSQATALHEAASKGFVSGARALLERGADPETETPQGVRPLHEAAAKGHIELGERDLARTGQGRKRGFCPRQPRSAAPVAPSKAGKKNVKRGEHESRLE